MCRNSPCSPTSPTALPFRWPLRPRDWPQGSRLKALAGQGVYFGTSSWKYEGWLGSVYSPERYHTRGKFSKAKFDADYLAEYAEVFPVVSGDFS